MTNTTTITPTELDSVYKNVIIFQRENGDKVTFCVQHDGEHRELDIAICKVNEPLDAVSHDIHPYQGPIEDEPKARVTLSYAEAKILCNLLNRPQVAVLLDQD